MASEATLEGRKLTPMMRQYAAAKAENPDAILMFRMGDFFEMFFEDARTAAKELDIVLTSRDKDADDGGIPMAGVPHHAITSYITRLVERGYTIAICDQVEDPKKAKGLVKREITRLVTPGTLSDLEALDPAAPSYLAHAALDGNKATLAMLELLAGELLYTECDLSQLADELRRMGARELLVEEGHREKVLQLLGVEPLPLRVIPHTTVLRTTVKDPAANRALSRLLEYAENTQRRKLEHVMAPRRYSISDSLVIDEATRRNLELCVTQLDGRKKGSLLWHLDRCRTAMGSRLLGHWLLYPLQDRARIERRLDTVGMLKEKRELREKLQRCLDQVRDTERLLGRVAVGRATPRDLGAIRASLAAVPRISALFDDPNDTLTQLWREVDLAGELRQTLQAALVDEPPTTHTDGGIFNKGFHKQLDELITLSTEGHDFLADLEARERKRTGINNLRVRFNKVFGYFIEVTKANLGQVPADYVRKQTLVNAERFITDELKSYEEKVLGADEKRKNREAELFAELLEQVAAKTNELRAISRLLAQTDLFCSLAQVADEGRYGRPTLVDEPVLQLEHSRHPVLERLMPGGERFVPNDISVDARDDQLLIVTGPNMAGKSTVMRQAALITILAHMGSFVPARKALVGSCDRVFTRVGAADNLGRGRSTFMVEMIETATILRYATDKSLILLDEIGRGTSTFDGLSIAWAVAEHLHDHVGARALFATHYHELTDLALERERIANVSIAVKEQNDQVVFLRRLVKGAANRSYGIEVARLAGLPDGVLRRAREVLQNLEASELDERGKPALGRPASGGQMSLFGRRGPSELEQALEALDPLNMTPLEALAEIDRLKKLLQKD